MGKPVKVLQIGMTHNIGGMETYLMSQYRKLDRDKIRYDFLNITGEKDIAYSREILDKGDRIFSVPTRSIHPLSHYLSVISLLYKVRKQYKYIVLNTCSLYYIFPLFIGMLVGIPHRVIHSHNSGYEIKIGLVRKLLIFFNKFLMKISATDYFACSKLAGKWMFGKHPFKIIHNAIDTDKFIYNPEVRKEVRGELGLEGKFVLGNVARFSYQKNHEFLIDVFRAVVAQEKDAVLLLIGSANGDEARLAMIKDKVKKYHLGDKVIFLGLRQDTNRLYQAMDCLVMPSRFEGLSVVAIEAQAAGLPCVCSTAMTGETKITNNFFQVDLNESEEKWADKILSSRSVGRKNMFQTVCDSGYDINMVVKLITSFYLL